MAQGPYQNAWLYYHHFPIWNCSSLPFTRIETDAHFLSNFAPHVMLILFPAVFSLRGRLLFSALYCTSYRLPHVCRRPSQGPAPEAYAKSNSTAGAIILLAKCQSRGGQFLCRYQDSIPRNVACESGDPAAWALSGRQLQTLPSIVSARASCRWRSIREKESSPRCATPWRSAVYIMTGPRPLHGSTASSAGSSSAPSPLRVRLFISFEVG
jgi:hypothetical protein